MNNKNMTQLSNENPDLNQVQHLHAKEDRDDDYWLLVDRLIPFVSPGEIIRFFRQWNISIVGMGGMGGWIFLALVRLGLLHFKIADPESFDATNKGRQAGAFNETLGKNKALETARIARSIFDGNTIDVYPMGAQEDSIASLVEGADLVFNEVEFWAIGSRILVDREARRAGVPVITCPTVGHSTYTFLSDTQSPSLEEFWKISYGEAAHLQEKIQSGQATQRERDYVQSLMFEAFVPFGFTEYSRDPQHYAMKPQAYQRLAQGTAPIFGVNALLSAADITQRAIIYLLNQQSMIKRKLTFPDSFPSGEYFNYLTRETKTIRPR